jgi:molecular chaperone GrpE (heat shock protein)
MILEDDEYSLMDGMEKLVDILNGAAEGLDELAESFGASDEEIAELNDGKTQEEIDLEDAMAAKIAAPLVNVLDNVTDILNFAAEKVRELTFGTFDDGEQTGEPEMRVVSEEEHED